MYYGSYRYPRTLVWALGTIIFILLIATAFMGYVLPFGQMSLWGSRFYYLTGKEVKRAPKPDKKFIAMFMGLVDGDGYIEIGPQKQYNKSGNIPKSTIRARMVIRLHSRDLSLLTYLTEVLGICSISSLDSIDQTRLIFSKKDLTTVIIPLIKEYGLQFLTGNRCNQFALLNYILDNNLVHWENVNFTPNFSSFSAQDLLNLNFFAYWLVGFTIAEGSFGVKVNGSAFFQIRQKGLENYNLIKAICVLIADRKPNIKADYSHSYQLSLSSKDLDLAGVKKVVYFFSASDTMLHSHKLIQYNEWLVYLKTSKRYKDTVILN